MKYSQKDIDVNSRADFSELVSTFGTDWGKTFAKAN